MKDKESELKALPVGVENFGEMILENYYYVDKTLLIKDLLDKKGKVNLFTRPRRFGKSLNISMIQHFFDNQYKDKKHLFDGLHIKNSGERYLIHQNEYPVIKMGFKDVIGSNFDEAFKLLKPELAGEYSRHDYLLESSKLRDHEKKLYEKILIEEATVDEYKRSLKFLSQCLEKHHSKKVIILIDEYDVPLEKAYFEDYYDDMVKFIRSLFSAALKTNDSLHFAVITGCLRVSRESIFTGLNNLNIVSILTNGYGEYFGFTDLEVSEMLAYYGLMHKHDEMQDWYNGYLFGESIVYNPWSGIKYLSDMYEGMSLAVPHWSNTSSNTIIRDLIKVTDNNVKEEIERLIAGEVITKPIKEDIVYADIAKNMNNLWSFLFFTGYLKKISKTQIGVHNYIELAIPNKEIQYIYESQIIEWFDEKVQMADLTNLYTAILDKDTKAFQYELSEILKDTISYFDSKEDFYHGFLTALMRTMKDYTIKSNRESGNGRGDIFIRPVSIRKPAIVIEVKIADEAFDLVKQSHAAVKQIQDKKYDDELLREGYTDIIKYGIAFYRKDCEIKLHI